MDLGALVKLTFELYTGILHDWARRPALTDRCREGRCGAMKGAVLGDGRVHDFITTGNREAVLSAYLAGSASLGTNFSTERIDFLDD